MLSNLYDLSLVEGSYSASVRGERKGGIHRFSQLPHPVLAICQEVTFHLWVLGFLPGFSLPLGPFVQ